MASSVEQLCLTELIRTPFNMVKMNTASGPFKPPGLCSLSRFRSTARYGGTPLWFVGQSDGMERDRDGLVFGPDPGEELSGDPE
jgi:hypothetical protein